MIPPNLPCLFSSFLFFLAISHTSDEKDSPIIINESMLHVWLGQFAWFYWWNSNDDISLWYTPNPLRLADFQPISNRWNRRHGLLFRWTCGRVVVSYDVGGKGFDPTVGKITETSGEVFVMACGWVGRFLAFCCWGLLIYCKGSLVDFFLGWSFLFFFLDGCFDFGCFFLGPPAKKNVEADRIWLYHIFLVEVTNLIAFVWNWWMIPKRHSEWPNKFQFNEFPPQMCPPSNMLLESSDTNGNISLTITIHAWHIYPHFGLFVW